MASALPLLLLGGAAVMLLGKKKKKNGKAVPKEPVIGPGGLPPEYLQNEKVDISEWGSIRAPRSLALTVGQNSFTHVGTRPSEEQTRDVDPVTGEPPLSGVYYTASAVSSSDPSIISIDRDQQYEDSPIMIFKPHKPGQARLTISRDDGAIFILDVLVQAATA